ncbi:hypothetical protein D1007_46808 [Hordeum vulgare]|nr:hypothetical protein D1007_46808 [Hordeum vulgare]
MASDDEQWTDDEWTEEDEKAMVARNEIVDRARARQRARHGGGKPRIRVEDDAVIYILSLEKDGIDYVDDRGDRFTLEEMKDIVDFDIDGDDEIDERQARVMRELSEKGYVEVDDKYLGDDDEYLQEANEFSRKEWERLTALTLSRRLARMEVAVENGDDEVDDDYYSELEEEEGENPDDQQILLAQQG